MRLNIENKARLAFAVLLLAGACAGLVWFFVASSRYATYEVHTRDAVSGLIADAPVEFHGVEVGRVDRVELIDPHLVSIVLSLKRQAPVTMATVATITARGLASRGFTGYVYVSLEDDGGDCRPIVTAPGEPHPLIRSAPSRSLNLDTAISQVNENVRVMTDLLQTTLDDKTVASLKQSADNLQQVTRTLAANNKRIATIVANTEQASRQFKPLMKSSSDTVKTLQTQVVPEAYRSLSKLNQLSGSLNGAAAKIDRDPSILVRGVASPPPGPGENR
jgi:phospholipid/cholesterol/gamma-HCH transport system substrate-binding protein